MRIFVPFLLVGAGGPQGPAGVTNVVTSAGAVGTYALGNGSGGPMNSGGAGFYPGNWQIVSRFTFFSAGQDPPVTYFVELYLRIG